MADYSTIASDSMKQLTERVIKADMAQRKRKMIQTKAMGASRILLAPCFVHVKSRFKSVNSQAGDPVNLYKIFMGGQISPFRQIFRPEIFHQNEFSKLMELAKITEREVNKNDKIKFKPYVWH